MFSATLKFKGREYDVRYVDYLIKRDIDAKGRPSSHLYGGLIRLIVESSRGHNHIGKYGNSIYSPCWNY